MKWGVFPTYDDWALEAVHIAPCDAEGELSPRHVLSVDCPCGPKVEDYDAMFPPIVIHEMEQ